MSTFFLRKKIYMLVAIICAVFFVLFSLGYGVFLSQTKVVFHHTAFYMVAAEETHVEAGAEFVKLEGGAGYLFYVDGKDYVVLSVYLHEKDAEMVFEGLKTEGRAVQVLSVQIENLYFKGKEKSKVKTYVSALNILKEYLSVIEQCTTLLDKGATQESVKDILSLAERHFQTLAMQYREKYSSFAELCAYAATELQTINSQVVFSSDLRYLSCALVDGYFNLCNQFTV